MEIAEIRWNKLLSTLFLYMALPLCRQKSRIAAQELIKGALKHKRRSILFLKSSYRTGNKLYTFLVRQRNGLKNLR